MELTIIEYICLIILSAPWTIWFINLTRGVFKNERSLFEPVHVTEIDPGHPEHKKVMELLKKKSS